MHTYVQGYVRGCARCQDSKPIMHQNKLPVQPIYPELPSKPFLTIAMDFIVKLPVSQGYDLVLTITNNNCIKAVILLRCKEEMDLANFTRLYLKYVFLFVEIPQ
jgi:hypothetical protein